MNELIARILRSSRGQPAAGGAPMQPAMVDPQQAMQSQMQGQGQQNPFLPNPGLEQSAVQGGNNIPVNPLIQQIMQHIGLLNLMRNRTIQPFADPSQTS